MKFFSIFLMFLQIEELESVKRNALFEAFSDISDFLARRNHLVSIIVGDVQKTVLNDVLSKFDDIPHCIKTF